MNWKKVLIVVALCVAFGAQVSALIELLLLCKGYVLIVTEPNKPVLYAETILVSMSSLITVVLTIREALRKD